MAVITDRIRNSFDKQTLMKTFEASIEAVEEGFVVIRAPILTVARQQHGAGHAALAFGLGDSAAGYAALSVMPEDAEVMTVEMKINLLSPILGDWLFAEGRVVRAGRRLVVTTAEVFSETKGVRKQVAIMQGTMIPA
ncbi:PaaI family thioesterase [Rhodophyticola sp. SM2404]